MTKAELRAQIHTALPGVRSARAMPEFRALKARQCRFLVALVQNHMSPMAAHRQTGIAYSEHYRWKHNSEKYQKALEKCYDITGDVIESSMISHAEQGFAKGIYYKGKRVGTELEYNAQERIALLKGLKPQYRDNFNLALVQGPQNLAVQLFGAEPQKSLIIQGETSEKPKEINPPDDEKK